MGRLRINEKELVSRLKAGERDFTGASLIGPIDVSLGHFGDLGDLILDKVLVVGDCFIGDLSARSLSLVGARSWHKSRFGFNRLNVDTVYGKEMRHRSWFSITTGTIFGIDFSHSAFGRGFLIKNTPLQALILDHCLSPYSLFDEERVTSLTKTGAELGRRTPETLGELYPRLGGTEAA